MMERTQEKSLLYITVSELREQAVHQQIHVVNIHRSPEGYALVCRLKWKDEEHLLKSAKNQIRYWKNLDLLVEFILREGINVSDINVKLNWS